MGRRKEERKEGKGEGERERKGGREGMKNRRNERQVWESCGRLQTKQVGRTAPQKQRRRKYAVPAYAHTRTHMYACMHSCYNRQYTLTTEWMCTGKLHCSDACETHLCTHGKIK